MHEGKNEERAKCDTPKEFGEMSYNLGWDDAVWDSGQTVYNPYYALVPEVTPLEWVPFITTKQVMLVETLPCAEGKHLKLRTFAIMKENFKDNLQARVNLVYENNGKGKYYELLAHASFHEGGGRLARDLQGFELLSDRKDAIAYNVRFTCNNDIGRCTFKSRIEFECVDDTPESRRGVHRHLLPGRSTQFNCGAPKARVPGPCRGRPDAFNKGGDVLWEQLTIGKVDVWSVSPPVKPYYKIEVDDKIDIASFGSHDCPDPNRQHPKVSVAAFALRPDDIKNDQLNASEIQLDFTCYLRHKSYPHVHNQAFYGNGKSINYAHDIDYDTTMNWKEGRTVMLTRRPENLDFYKEGAGPNSRLMEGKDFEYIISTSHFSAIKSPTAAKLRETNCVFSAECRKDRGEGCELKARVEFECVSNTNVSNVSSGAAAALHVLALLGAGVAAGLVML